MDQKDGTYADMWLRSFFRKEGLAQEIRRVATREQVSAQQRIQCRPVPSAVCNNYVQDCPGFSKPAATAEQIAALEPNPAAPNNSLSTLTESG